MSYIIDRRLNPKGKSLGNRQRFIRRARESIKQAVKDKLKNKNISDIGQGDVINIPIKDISEPNFTTSREGGTRNRIFPGNKDYTEGEKIDKPSGGSGGGGGGGEASDSKELGADDFQFQLTRDEFLDFFFEDLELPDLIKKQLKDTKNYKLKYSGITTSGPPANRHVIRSFKNSIARRLALHRPDDEELEELKNKLKYYENNNNLTSYEKQEYKNLLELYEELKNKQKRIPFIDEKDIRYRLFLKQPEPSTKAVMFCLMDVSGSMGEREKQLSKSFFMLLYLFLERQYEKIEVVFVRHHTTAEEVDEQKFFYDKENGGTIVSSCLEKTIEIINERYNLSDWNIYVSQASDGENWSEDDSAKCHMLLKEKLLPIVQYYAYIEIAPERYQYDTSMFTPSDSSLWKVYIKLNESCKNFEMKRISNSNQIYPVFRELFEKK